jgi:hypothetical protein
MSLIYQTHNLNIKKEWYGFDTSNPDWIARIKKQIITALNV